MDSTSASQSGCTFEARAFASLSAADVYAALALRAAVFVVEQRCAYLDVDGRDLHAWHILGRDNQGALLAYARILPAESVHHTTYIGRVVVTPGARSSGLGGALMRYAIATCTRVAPGPIALSAQSHLQAFYGNLGFASSGAEYDEDGIPHVHMHLQPRRA